MSKPFILIATEKPFAPVAKTEIAKTAEKLGYPLKWFENYKKPEELWEAVKDAEAMVIRSDLVTPEVVDKAQKLKIVVRAGAGFDNVNLKACTDKKIVVMNTPGQNANAVAELVFGLIVMAIRGGYQGTNGWELKGKKLGLHGFGAIGKCMTLIAKGFGMTVMAYDVVDAAKKAAQEMGVEYTENLDQLYQSCDVVSLHAPMNAHTKGVVNARLLHLMKPAALLFNSARDGLIVEEDLKKFMAERPKFLFGADVKPKIADELQKEFGYRCAFSLKKMGAMTTEANTNAGVAAINQISGFLEKGDISAKVN